jgi:hypothetical protein
MALMYRKTAKNSGAKSRARVTTRRISEVPAPAAGERNRDTLERRWAAGPPRDGPDRELGTPAAFGVSHGRLPRRPGQTCPPATTPRASPPVNAGVRGLAIQWHAGGLRHPSMDSRPVRHASTSKSNAPSAMPPPHGRHPCAVLLCATLSSTGVRQGRR